MDYKECAQRVLDLVGGPGNVESFTIYMTRLRLNLVSPHAADVEAIMGLDGVFSEARGSFRTLREQVTVARHQHAGSVALQCSEYLISAG
ncbi:PTS transporter subunit EIIB [Cutibacterium avidum]|uniref:PTS transporter subunit EIIB n=1 Tax=Cutibacterium avidum TaxID=33010 RepID=UPI00080F81AC|nr:hypothetical protein A9G02_01250 [Cutibacterium avidum]